MMLVKYLESLWNDFEICKIRPHIGVHRSGAEGNDDDFERSLHRKQKLAKIFSSHCGQTDITKLSSVQTATLTSNSKFII